MTPQQFKAYTKVKGKPRSRQLQAIDDALARYDRAKSGNGLETLARAILAWQDAKANWYDSIRKTGVVHLINYVKGEGARTHRAKRCVFNYVHCEAEWLRFEQDPERWLGANELTIGGGGDGAEAMQLAYDCGSVVYDHTEMKPSDPLFQLNGKYQLSAAARGYPVNVFNVAMHRDFTPDNTDEPRVTGRLVPLTGAVMTTGLLSGCSFVVRDDGGALSCTHIEPRGFPRGDGGPLQDALDGLTMGGVTIYGRNDYDAYSTVIGVRRGTAWKIYGQERNQPRDGQITGVTRIYG